MSLSGMTVLVCDDEKELCDLMTSLLENEGAQVIKAYDGEQAWNALGGNKFDAVISDIRMPKLDGIGLLRRISKISPPQPMVILMSAYADINSKDAKALGAHQVVAKPFEIKEIISELQGIKAESNEN